MNPHGKFRCSALLVGWAIAAVGLAGSTSAGAVHAAHAADTALPEEPCALLQPAEIQEALAPKAEIGAKFSDTESTPLGVGCTYTWGPKSPEWGEPSLTLTVIDAVKGWPGLKPEQLVQGIRAKVMAGGPNASEIAGVGDVAAFTFYERVSNATVEAYFEAKGVHLTVHYHAGDSLQSKDKLVALLKKAAARL